MENKKIKVLVVEDDKDISELITLQLSAKGYQVKTTQDGAEAQCLIENDPSYSLYIIDWMLPRMSGVELCRYLRKKEQTMHSPILMVTALTKKENIVEGLDAGADDYVTKPFDMDELQARVRALSRRASLIKMSSGDYFEKKNLKIDFKKYKVWCEQKEISLTPKEYKLLATMVSGPGRVFTRQQLNECIQEENVFVTDRTIDTHVAALRKKLGSCSSLIETIRGIGYRVIDE